MNKSFSIITGGFYANELRSTYENAGTWPDDAVEVDIATEGALRAAICRGDTISYSNVKFTFTAAPALPFAPIAVAYLDSVRVIREQVLNRLAGIGMAALLAADTFMAQEAATARQALLDITIAPAVLAATDLDGLEKAMRDAYVAIIAAAPPVIREAFDPDAI
ncbi:hypothetical protein [Janthinobacterium agaricidamnosum]|uniref:hypothetical protein n=1 Tax=Janthinobacterium agaricidamnosum TaxID=55508 RepID=UPI001969AE03|nr:hypothetical protein [Janthinobacterium agaricidamnosum]